MTYRGYAVSYEDLIVTAGSRAYSRWHHPTTPRKVGHDWLIRLVIRCQGKSACSASSLARSYGSPSAGTSGSDDIGDFAAVITGYHVTDGRPFEAKAGGSSIYDTCILEKNAFVSRRQQNNRMTATYDIPCSVTPLQPTQQHNNTTALP